MTSSVSHPHPRQPSGDSRVVARVYALTDVGHTRDHNEDTFLVADLEGGGTVSFDARAMELASDRHGLLFLVADGMGGAASGELASSMAGDVILDTLRAGWGTATALSPEEFAASLRDAAETANSRIHRFSRENPEHRGMGTTATIAGLLDDRLYLAQVGDSRAYLVRKGGAEQLTKDQSLMQRLVEAGEMTQEQADASDRRNIILQALGPEPHVTIDLTHQQVRRGDTLVLCSDGLSGLVRPGEIAAIATEESDPRLVCQRLVDRANELGGPDNITVVVARFDGAHLGASHDDDPIGYTAYPLRGTLNDDTVESPIPEMETRTSSRPEARADALSAAQRSVEEEFERAHAAAEAESIKTDPVMAPASTRWGVWLVLAIVIAALVWLITRFIGD